MASSGGFYIIFFGVAASLSRCWPRLAWRRQAWLQWLLFSVLSVVSLLLFRNPLMRKLNLGAGAADIDTLAGETGTALEDMGAGRTGRSNCAARRGARATPARLFSRAVTAASSSRRATHAARQAEEAV